MTRFATLRQTDTAAPFAALGPRLAAPEAAAPDRLGVYLETLQILDRLHRLMLDLVKDEFERLGQTDLTPVQALLIYNLGDAEVSAGELRSRGMYQGSNVSYNLKKLVQMGYVHHQRSDMDRRSVRVRLTPQGEAVRGMIYRMFARHAAGLAASGVLDDPPLEQVNPQLRRVERFWSEQIRYIY
ncbi:MarR family winged helix-turn-helix transcriptional regulator [Paracoccus sanguinis]|uniref:DNA-binding transcriptional regulator, MarR family n=1 Tax=Paracoccus sanguinis TaxID=1545044 RepID=A0A1H2TJE3_9RHOB|nr:winged helix DNA-binding protein [Paracoccus sanguinis]QJD17194.1 MarR family transcriptional regulator [Paracoccus sanguinis]SDW43992.1 DNA-binding transcriptional regulator, MarR family [Paracoccus sanguinis]